MSCKKWSKQYLHIGCNISRWITVGNKSPKGIYEIFKFDGDIIFPPRFRRYYVILPKMAISTSKATATALGTLL